MEYEHDMRYEHDTMTTPASTAFEPGVRPILRTVIAGALLVSILAGPLAADEKLEEVTVDGLHLVPGPAVAAAHGQPDADFRGYHRLQILDVYVAFRKNWARDRSRGSIHQITNRDIEKIKQGMAELFREVFIEELDTKGGYPVVDSPDTDVLLRRPAIIDLDVTAPDLDRGGRSYTFASSAGAAPLFLELYDSVSGEILARVFDPKAANNPGDIMRWSNWMTNRAEASRILAGWAGLLRARLDEIHGRGKE